MLIRQRFREVLLVKLKENSSRDEMLEEIGSLVHDKLTFWDLAKLKLKHGDNDKLKITYSLLDDYTLLYSNMSKLLESLVSQQSAPSSRPISAIMSNKRFHFDEDSSVTRKVSCTQLLTQHASVSMRSVFRILSQITLQEVDHHQETTVKINHNSNNSSNPM